MAPERYSFDFFPIQNLAKKIFQVFLGFPGKAKPEERLKDLKSFQKYVHEIKHIVKQNLG